MNGPVNEFRRFLLLFLIVFSALGLSNTVQAQKPPTVIPSSKSTEEIRKYLQYSPFTKFSTAVVGNPIQNLLNYNRLPSNARVPEKIIGIAGVLAFLGFVLSLWRAVTLESEKMIKGAIANFAISALMMGLCFNYQQNSDKVHFSFSKSMFYAWGTTYDWSRDAFAGDMDIKLLEAKNGFDELATRVVEAGLMVALPGAAGIAKTTVTTMAKVASGKTMGGLIKAGIEGGKGIGAIGASAVKGTSGAVFGQLKYFMVFLNLSLVVYSGLITVSGLLVLAVIYILPFAFAAINFGSTRILWAAFGTFFSAWFTVLLLPMFLAVSVDQTFIQPARAMQYYAEIMAIKTDESQTQSQTVLQPELQKKMDSAVQSCEQAANPDAKECLVIKGDGFFSGLTESLWTALKGAFSWIAGLFTDIINGIIQTLLGLLVAIAGMVISLGIMAATPARFAGLLGGVAESVKERMGK
jgi:hypothetical protein